MKYVAFFLIGMVIILNGCATQKAENTSLKNTVYVLESVKDVSTGKVFSFRDYCAFNAERGLQDSDLDKTLADSGAWLELHFSNGTAELKLEAGDGYKSAAFLDYQKYYASSFTFTEDKNAVELTLNLDTLDAEMKASIEAMSVSERDTILKSVFEKSKDILIEVDEDDNVINYWRRVK